MLSAFSSPTSDLEQAAACMATCCQYQSACKRVAEHVALGWGLGWASLGQGGVRHYWKKEVAIRLLILSNLLLGFSIVGFTVQDVTL